MNTLIHADIFFFITTIWVIIISVICVIILWNVAIIVNDLRHISKKIRQGSDIVSENLHDLQNVIKSEGANTKYVWKYIKKLFSHRGSSKK